MMSGLGLEVRVIYCELASLVGIRLDGLFSTMIYLEAKETKLL